MLNIRPVSDLRNKFPEIESLVISGQPVYITKNGYGFMVCISIEDYSKMLDLIENKLDEADYVAATNPERLSHQEVFDRARKAAHEL